MSCQVDTIDFCCEKHSEDTGGWGQRDPVLLSLHVLSS